LKKKYSRDHLIMKEKKEGRKAKKWAVCMIEWKHFSRCSSQRNQIYCFWEWGSSSHDVHCLGVSFDCTEATCLISVELLKLCLMWGLWTWLTN
jgi:hypothetical protein